MQLILIAGEDNYSSERKLAEIQKSYAQKYPDLQITSSQADEVKTIAEIPYLKGEIGFFSQTALVVVRNLLSEGAASLRQQFEDYLSEHQTAGSVAALVLLERGNADKRLKLYKLAKDIGQVYEFKEPQPSDKEKFIRDHIWAKGWELDNDTKRELVSLLQQRQLAVIDSELTKLDLLLEFEQRTDLTRQDLLLLNRDLQAEVWELLKLALTNKKAAYELLDRLLLQQMHHLQIIGFLAYEVRKLILYHYAPQEVNPFVRKQIAAAAGSLSRPRLKYALDKLINLDLTLKSTNMDPRLGLTLYLSIL